VKFDIDPSAGNEIANAHIGFNLVFDGVQAGGSGGDRGRLLFAGMEFLKAQSNAIMETW